MANEDSSDRFHKMELEIHDIKSSVSSIRDSIDRGSHAARKESSDLWQKIDNQNLDLYGKDGLITNMRLVQDWMLSKKRMDWMILSCVIALVVSSVWEKVG